MSDESQVPEPVQPAPLPVPTPPPPAPTRWRRVLYAVLALVIVGQCALGVRYAFKALDAVFGGPESETVLDQDVAVAGSGYLTVARTTGDGRYVVVQHATAAGVPVVVAIDVAAGHSRVLEGYRALFVEPVAPVVWIEKVDPEAGLTADGLGDTFDHVPEQLLVWRLDERAPHEAPSEQRWEPIAGPGGVSAFLTGDGTLGAGPSRLAFGPTGGSPSTTEALGAVSAERTLVPVGWSPSGRWFAVEELLLEDPDEIAARPAAYRPVRMIHVVDPSTGRPVSSQEVPALGLAPAAMWDPNEDVLVWIEPSWSSDPASSTSDGTWSASLQIVRLAVSADGATKLSLDDDTSRIDATVLAMPTAWGPLGASEHGMVWWVGGSVYRIGESGAVDLSLGRDQQPDSVPAWDSERHLLVQAYVDVTDDGTQRLVVKRMNEYGANSHTLWQGLEERPTLFGR
jgi:hypothetical protein